MGGCRSASVNSSDLWLCARHGRLPFSSVLARAPGAHLYITAGGLGQQSHPDAETRFQQVSKLRRHGMRAAFWSGDSSGHRTKSACPVRKSRHLNVIYGQLLTSMSKRYTRLAGECLGRGEAEWAGGLVTRTGAGSRDMKGGRKGGRGHEGALSSLWGDEP